MKSKFKIGDLVKYKNVPKKRGYHNQFLVMNVETILEVKCLECGDIEELVEPEKFERIEGELI